MLKLFDTFADLSEKGLGGDYYGTSTGQRERMMTATQTMDKTNERLAFAKEQLGQTEVGNAAMLGVPATQNMGDTCLSG